jgi:hypothetical protein
MVTSFAQQLCNSTTHNCPRPMLLDLFVLQPFPPGVASLLLCKHWRAVITPRLHRLTAPDSAVTHWQQQQQQHDHHQHHQRRTHGIVDHNLLILFATRHNQQLAVLFFLLGIIATATTHTFSSTTFGALFLDGHLPAVGFATMPPSHATRADTLYSHGVDVGMRLTLTLAAVDFGISLTRAVPVSLSSSSWGVDRACRGVHELLLRSVSF